MTVVTLSIPMSHQDEMSNSNHCHKILFLQNFPTDTQTRKCKLCTVHEAVTKECNN